MMKRLLLIISLILPSLLSLYAQEQETVKRIAILKTVDEVGDVKPGVKLNLRGTLAYAINHMPGYEGYTRVNLSGIMDEHKFQRSGFVDDNQIKQIGKATGAQYILIAEVAYFDEQHITVTASIIDIETARIKESSDPVISPIDPDEMRESCIKIARSLLGVDDISISGDAPKGGSVHENVFHKRLDEDLKQRGTLIYAQSPSDNQYCDGNYNDKKDFFSVNLKSLIREHFCIIFTFEALEYKGMWALMLSRGWRILGIYLKEDGYIYITTDNQRNYYATGLTYTPRKSKKIELEYDNGVVNINGVRLNVDMNEYNGDNNLSSLNYSNGTAFWGYINSVRVYNMR